MPEGLIGTYKSSMYAFRDSDGYAMGQLVTPDSPVVDTVYGGYFYDKHIDISGIALTYEKRQGFAGGKIWTQRVVGISDIGDVTINISGRNTTLEGYISGFTPDTTTVASATGMSRNASNPTPPKMISVHHEEFDNADGSAMWQSHFILNAQFRNEGGTPAGQGSGQNPNAFPYVATVDFSLRLPWGQLYSANANNVVSDNRDVSYDIISAYRYLIATYICDGTEVTYTLPYKPASSTVGDHYVYRNGTALTLSSVSVSTGVATMPSAGSSGDIVVHLYPVGNVLTAT